MGGRIRDHCRIDGVTKFQNESNDKDFRGAVVIFVTDKEGNTLMKVEAKTQFAKNKLDNIGKTKEVTDDWKIDVPKEVMDKDPKIEIFHKEVPLNWNKAEWDKFIDTGKKAAELIKAFKG